MSGCLQDNYHIKTSGSNTTRNLHMGSWDNLKNVHKPFTIQSDMSAMIFIYYLVFEICYNGIFIKRTRLSFYSPIALDLLFAESMSI